MNTKMTSLVVGLVLFGAVSIANAAEPLRLTEASMDAVTAAGGKKHDHDHAQWGKHFDKDFFKGTKIAVATADASCKGGNCLTATDAQAHVTPWGAVSSSVALAVSVPN